MSNYRHIYFSLLLVFLSLWTGQVQAAPTIRRQAALQVVAAADSMDAAHMLYSDTAALRNALRTLDRPVRRHRYRNALAAAYYYMGRNMSLNSDYARAADCYIACDRLHPDDPIRRGRVNACMAYICTQHGEDSLALVFNQRSLEAFRNSNNIWYYAHKLLFLSENYCKLGEYHIADSLWQEASAFQIDSTYRFYVLETRGLNFYYRQQYDSALTCFLQIEDYPRSNQSKCYDYMKIVQIYESLGKSALAYPYADYILRYSTNPTQISNAYYTLINYAEQIDDAALVATYSHNREDAGREKRALSNRNSAAVEKCRQYLANPYPNRKWHIVVGVAVLLCGILGTAILLLRYRKRKDIKQKDTLIRQQHLLLCEKDRQIQQQSALLQMQNTLLQKQELLSQQLQEELTTKRIQDLEVQISHLRAVFPKPCSKWNRCEVMLRDLSPAFLHLYNALEEKNLKEQEIRLCIYYLLYHDKMPLTEIAGYICKSSTGIRTIKSRIAHKLGVTSAQLYDFLLKMAV